jgi:hypothetical protein
VRESYSGGKKTLVNYDITNYPINRLSTLDGTWHNTWTGSCPPSPQICVRDENYDVLSDVTSIVSDPANDFPTCKCTSITLVGDTAPTVVFFGFDGDLKMKRLRDKDYPSSTSISGTMSTNVWNRIGAIINNSQIPTYFCMNAAFWSQIGKRDESFPEDLEEFEDEEESMELFGCDDQNNSKRSEDQAAEDVFKNGVKFSQTSGDTGITTGVWSPRGKACPRCQTGIFEVEVAPCASSSF